ncbi:MAG: KdsC family phosphatase [Mucilaginibacter sp.]|uniref:KdsC family phosphatase n=1 Tax=Mucilaginibacter sp. L3T2-6 TaxID=3062491 RepID=UPI0026762FE0|nr:HAD-IIIA family hydrolase [Mucilaginibacter sp. L3T2-6]MDO3642660.1 HAD-IIIA family hydrolase [Mucilaginibacter sp. L3T2-6]MDV6217780.1 HAD-IIIA family hydrolase [Mucilaginibacter sp. L3T2-6]
MESFLTKLKEITTFVFDVDGVLTDGSVFVTDDGLQSRAFNIKDGYALQLAVKCGYNVVSVSGSRSKAQLHRLNSLGIKDVYMGIHTKKTKLKLYLEEKHISPETVLYMGDDIPDMEVMQYVGLPVCPADAVEEIKALSKYVSPYPGGRGCVRDVIEKVLKIHDQWLTEEAYSW